MNRRLLATTVTGALVAALTACGIPAQTEVRVDGQVATPLSGTVSGSGSEPPTRLATEDTAQFVLNYLQAAAGETAGAYERAKRYIADEDRGTLREKQGADVTLTVVRVTGEPSVSPRDEQGRQEVVVAVQQVGVLRADGVIEPPVAGGPDRYVFTVGQVPSQVGRDEPGLFLFEPPNLLLLSTTGLDQFYSVHTIYFWSLDRTTLIADRRYLPTAVPVARRATEVLGWLTGGPADWLRRVARPLPEGSKVVGNVVQAENRLEVPLTGPAGSLDDEGELDLLATQIAWSLPDLDGQLELRIRNQSRKVVDADDRRTGLVRSFEDVPRRFCVYQGRVWGVAMPGQEPGAVPVAPEANVNVVTAGLSRVSRNVAAALVTAVGDRRRLAVGIGPEPVASFVTNPGLYASMGRPVWLRVGDQAKPTGLVVADGKLHRFDTDARMTEIGLPDAPGPVTAVGAALDGRRIAFVAGGTLYVAGLNADGPVVSVGPARRLPVSLTGLTAVDWIGTDSLVVAGERAPTRPVIYGVSVDGVQESELRQTGAAVTHLAAYPSNRMMFEAGGVVWVDKFSDFERIRPDRLVGGPAGPPAAADGGPVAPFFLS